MLVHGWEYFIAKNNATLMVLSKIFQEVDKVKEDLNFFINNPNVKKINPNPVQENSSFFEGLNDPQVLALKKVLRNQITFIKGPPGCGKTKTIARICRVFGSLKSKILVGAVSKSANLAITRSLLEDIK